MENCTRRHVTSNLYAATREQHNQWTHMRSSFPLPSSGATHTTATSSGTQRPECVCITPQSMMACAAVEVCQCCFCAASAAAADWVRDLAAYSIMPQVSPSQLPNHSDVDEGDSVSLMQSLPAFCRRPTHLGKRNSTGLSILACVCHFTRKGGRHHHSSKHTSD